MPFESNRISHAAVEYTAKATSPLAIIPLPTATESFTLKPTIFATAPQPMIFAIMPTKTKALDVALTGFMHSQEFLDKNLGDADFVKVLYRTFLDREFDPAGLNDWVTALASGKSRDDVAAGFAYSQEFSEIMSIFGIK